MPHSAGDEEARARIVLARESRASTLDLAQLRLGRVPSEIGELTWLEDLRLDGNALTEIPAEIGRLTRLECLDASSNQIRTLPRELGLLRRLHTLKLGGNPLRDPVPALIESGISDLFAYLHSLEDATRQYEAKLLLVGEGETGKSRLIASLTRARFERDRESTQGIEVSSVWIDHPDLDVEMQLHAWDFGGQEVYRINHQFFFSRRAIYLVVWKPRQGQDEGAIEDWCQRIMLRVGAEAKILLVATHANERASELDYPLLRARFGDVLVGSHAVDNSDGSGIDALRLDIARHAADLPQMGEIVSASWQAARSELLALPEGQIPYGRCAEICGQHGLDGVSTRALVRMLHHLGLVIYYDEDDGLRDIVVLQPEWLTRAISRVLEDRPTREANGVLDHRRLPEIWGTDGYPAANHPYFLRLMEKFDVSYRIPETHQSLVAQLVPYERPQLPWREIERARTLSLRCTLSGPVDGLIAWLTVRHHRFSVGVHWRRGVFLEHAAWGAQGLLEMKDPQHLELTVLGPSPDGFLGMLLDGVDHLIEVRWEGLSYELLIPCKGRLEDGSTCPESFTVRYLERDLEDGDRHTRCRECRTRFDIEDLLGVLTPRTRRVGA